MVAGPAAFWAAVSPLLERLRVGSGHAIQSIVQAPEAITIPIDYMTARLEHLIPFLLIGVLTTMRTVNHDPRGFLERMGPTAALLSTRFSWWAGLREWVGREFRDQPGDPKSEGAFEVQERRGKH
jgi:hypothetical protein